MLSPWDFRFLNYILNDTAPFLGCPKNLAQTTLEMMDGFPRQPAVELTAQELLQFFPRQLSKLRLAESRNEMYVEHVPIVLLSCVLERWQDPKGTL